MTTSIGILILGMIAAFVIFRLYKVLGQIDEVAESQHIHQNKEMIDVTNSHSNFENREEEDNKILLQIKSENAKTEITNKIAYIKNLNKEFSLKGFIKSAESAYEIILAAYSNQELSTLKSLLTESTYEKFSKNIQEHLQKNSILNKTLISINKTEIDSITHSQNNVYITVKFHAQHITILKNLKGEIINGDPSIIDNIVDVWTFTKNISDENPIWYLENTSKE